jgi:5-methyltetrahydrofolate--homocysteine methyltransferase
MSAHVADRRAAVRERLEALMAERILVLDGAMGSLIQRRELGEADFRGERFADHDHDLAGDNDVLSLTRPDVIREIHEAYLEAGADVIETNTFSGTATARSSTGWRPVWHARRPIAGPSALPESRASWRALWGRPTARSRCRPRWRIPDSAR